MTYVTCDLKLNSGEIGRLSHKGSLHMEVLNMYVCAQLRFILRITFIVSVVVSYIFSIFDTQ